MAKRKPKDLNLLASDAGGFEEDNKKKKKIEIDEDDATMKMISKIVCDGKVSFAKASWGVGKGPYLLAFENSCDEQYCEMNAHEFKSINLNEAKKHKFIPVWLPGNKTPEQINALPRLNMEDFVKKSAKEKEEKKLARSAKIVASRKKR